MAPAAAIMCPKLTLTLQLSELSLVTTSHWMALRLGKISREKVAILFVPEIVNGGAFCNAE